jgi:hypothetical protein
MGAEAGPLQATAEAGQLQQTLLNGQNRDGGWPYQPGGLWKDLPKSSSLDSAQTSSKTSRSSPPKTSWTEPTALALLALAAQHSQGAAYDAGRSWLLKTQRADGGWAPQPGVDAVTSVTSLAVLALCQAPLHEPALNSGAQWILKNEYGDTPILERLAFRLLGASPPKAPGGSPWFPGTAAWIAPTAMSVLALSRFANVAPAPPQPSGQLRSAIKSAQDYILSRKCRDGGWNHGGSTFRSEDAESYPEMTGMALLALSKISSSELERPLRLASAFLNRPQPAAALSWLQLAILKHGHAIPASIAPPICRNTLDVSLRLIALAAAETGTLPQSLIA